ncbi:MAG: HAMP domain-containing protein [Proteobacteria bacterium]|nr:HAMP domain-containing protein [Pseudomonadota bacterium]
MTGNLAARFFVSYVLAIILSITTFIVANKLFPGTFLSLGLVVIFSLTIAAIPALIFSGKLKRRLKNMIAMTERVGHGNFDRSLISLSNDEIGKLETAFVRMSEEVRDFTGRLGEEKEKGDAVLSSMGEGVIVIDSKGDISLANKRANTIFASALTGKRVSDISRDPDFLSLLEKSSGNWSTINGELTISGPEKMIQHVTISPLIRNMKMSGSVIVLHDVTQLKQLEVMRKDFVVNLSHELKTPLTSIRGFAETLVEGGIDDKENALKFADTIKKNSERLSRLVDDLLTLSNIELGRIKFDIQAIDLLDPASFVISTLTQKANKKGLKLKLNISKGVIVKADRDRLEQVLLNLVDNALKFTEKGSVTISADKVKNMLEVLVSDTGIGIPEKSLHRLGERFYRVDHARSRELGGTGLGLAIVKHLVTSMGGTFFIESKEGSGTSVGFTLPAK